MRAFLSDAQHGKKDSMNTLQYPERPLEQPEPIKKRYNPRDEEYDPIEHDYLHPHGDSRATYSE